MKCTKHKDRIVLHAFSNGDCIVCNCNITTAHIPCDEVCITCSEKYELCRICGDYIGEDMQDKMYQEYKRLMNSGY